MRWIAAAGLMISLSVTSGRASAQSAKGFSRPDMMLQDAKHKEPKSGVQIGPGNTLTIQSGVGTPTTINVLSFNKDATLLAAGKEFGRAVVWDVPKRKFLCAIDTGQGIVSAVAISPDRQVLATAGQGDHFKLKLWHLPDGKLLKTYDSFQGYIHSLEFGPDGSWLILSENSGGIRAFDITNGNSLLAVEDAYSPVLSPDGSVLVAVNKSEFILWNTSNWAKRGALPRNPQYAIPLALNPEADILFISSGLDFQLLRSKNGEVVPTKASQPLPKLNNSAGGFATFDAILRELVFGHSEGRLWGWNIRTGQTCVSELMYSESGALSPDGRILAGAKDNSILAQGQQPNGVMIWSADRLAQHCGL